MVSQYRIPDSNPKGGLDLTPDENSKSIVIEMLKSIGRKILKGNFTDLMSQSRPASISYPLTFLQAASRDFSYTHYLTQASIEQDPLLRIELISSFIIAGFHLNPVEFKNNPPLNPVLGETFTGEMSDGSKIWLEQTSHHPPITHWYMQGPNNCYKFTGYGQIRAGLSGPNTIKASKIGKHVIEFKNGDIVEYTAPIMKISGVVIGQRNVNFEGRFEIIDKSKRIKAVFEFEKENGIFGSIKGKIKGFWKKETRLPSDCFKVVVWKRMEDGKDEVICYGEGSWLQYLKFADRLWWNAEIRPLDEWKRSQDFLPSDSSLRQDLQFLARGDVDRAQVHKDRLENEQRRDKVLRDGGSRSAV